MSARGLEKAARLRSASCVRPAVPMDRDDVIADARAAGSALLRFAKERSEASERKREE